MNNEIKGLEKVTRFEVIDHTGLYDVGRVLVRYFDNDVIELVGQLQDDGKTLKMFLGFKKEVKRE